jgi:hypothetical protein
MARTGILQLASSNFRISVTPQISVYQYTPHENKHNIVRKESMEGMNERVRRAKLSRNESPDQG